MNTVLILNKETFEVLQEKAIVKNTLLTPSIKDSGLQMYQSIIELVKDLVQLNECIGGKNCDDSVTLKLDGGKVVVYRKGKDTMLAIMIICDRKSFKRSSLIEISKIFLLNVEKDYMSSKNPSNFLILKGKETFLQIIDDLTVKFIDDLRKNKLFAKFIYYNYNPSVTNSISYKKSKLESTSVILFNSGKDYDRIVEQKDTMLQKSTIKEKELNIELEKKPNHPTDRKITIKKFNNIKSDSLKKKFMAKNFMGNFFIEKYFLTKNTMIHLLFNNVFVESPNQGNMIKENLCFPINADNDHLLLYLLDIYDKSQTLFSVTKPNGQEYLDIVNYIEINLNKPEVMLTKNKLAILKYKALFIIIQIEIYEDKNTWSSVNSNTSFYKEIESLFSIVHGETYHGVGE